VCTSEGVVLGVEKRVTSILLESSSIEKIVEIDSHIGCAMSGLTADARTMIDHARVESQNHRFTYDEPLRVESCTQAVCDLALRFGEGDDDENERVMSRPFGVALLVAGVDDDGPQLYFFRCDLLIAGTMLNHLGHFIGMMLRQLAPEVRVLKQSCRMNTSRCVTRDVTDYSQ
jgi:20S proteasome alpha/beta subunit